MTDTSARRERGALLFDQGRYDLAERELRDLLAASPEDGIAHALLALTLTEQDRLPEAEQEARTGIGLLPDEAFTHYALARVLAARRAWADAVASADEVIRRDPDHPRGYAVLAGARLGQRRWTDAVAATDAGLAIAPEHEGLLTIRGLALRQLGRGEESRASFEGALRRDPSNSYAHASRGLGLLHDGQMNEALAAFREALRLDPTNEMARTGLVEALKARNPIYAGMLWGMLAIGRLSGRATAFLFIGFFLVQRVLRELAEANPALAPIVLPLLGVYLFIAWLTFAASPLFNLLLRLDPVGRYALTDEQRFESSIVGPLVAIGLPAALLAILTGSTIAAIVAIVGLGLVVPIAAAFVCHRGWPRNVMFGIAGVIVLLGVIGIVQVIEGDEGVGFGLGILALTLASVSSWIALPLAAVQVRR